MFIGSNASNFTKIPLNVLQTTNEDGKVVPVALVSEDDSGQTVRQRIDSIISDFPFAKKEAGCVGRCYECVINGQPEHLFYSSLQPRKWYRLTNKKYDKNEKPDDLSVREVWYVYHRYIAQ